MVLQRTAMYFRYVANLKIKNLQTKQSKLKAEGQIDRKGPLVRLITSSAQTEPITIRYKASVKR